MRWALLFGLLLGPLLGAQEAVVTARKELAAGRPEAALALLEPLFARGNRDPALLRLLGEAALRADRVERAVAALEALTGNQQAEARDWLALARAYARRAERAPPGLGTAALRDALQAARRAAAKEPTNPDTWLAAARYARALGEEESARKLLAEGLARGGEKSKSLLLELARLEGKEGIRRLEAWLQAHGPDPEATVLIAELWAGAGRLDRARHTLLGVLREHPDYEPAYRLLWRLFGEVPARRPEGAAILKEVLARHPKALLARGYLANLHRVGGRTAEAERLYREILRLKPDYAWAYRALGELYAEKARRRLARPPVDRQAVRKELERAAEELFRYLDLAGRQGRLDPAVVPYLDVVLYDLSREGLAPAAAYRLHRRLLARFPQAWDLHHTFGLIAWDLGKFEEAEAAIREALRRAPPDRKALRTHYTNNLGLLYESWNRYEDARRQYEQAARMPGPAHLDALENLGKLHWKLGNPERALHYFRAVLAEDPERTASVFYFHLCHRAVERKRQGRR